MKILVVNLTKMVDDSGGLAKVTCAFSNEMKRRGHTVSLVYSDEKIGDFYYPLDDGIPFYDIRHFQGQSIPYPWYLKIKRELIRPFNKRKARTVNTDFAQKYLLENLQKVLDIMMPEVIVAFQSASSKMLLCDLHTSVPVITMSHGDPEDYFHTYPKAELPALEKSAVCQVLLPSFEKHLKDHLPNVKTVVIGNAIPQYDVQADLSAQKDTYKILFVGRLSKNHKRPHLLIEAFAGLADEFPNWNVELWGAEDGKAYYKELQLLIKKHHLENRVFLKGPTNDVPSVLQQGDIFAFPSAYEGFGLALGEAMSMGLPAVGYKSCSAVNELIKDGENGYLCDDGIEPLRISMKRLMSSLSIRVSLGEGARIDMKKYSSKVIWDTWENLLNQIVKQ
ncbi:glycosyltransferase [Megasphaera elsdenii]|uniref:glycosyltransferase n=1 Tax=Megasphaera elsdenii TaxID=907 RepID=UPI00195EAB9B|nr:glycosyltransferase [Megasphaera elsdenii]MBM6701567.1 glycosyltransferase [Megasphaera elsdenii]